MIRYALPVLWMTSYFHIMGPMVRHVYCGENITAVTTTSIHTKFCSTIQISKYKSWVEHALKAKFVIFDFLVNFIR